MANEEEKQKVRERQKGYKTDEIVVIKAVEPVSLRDTRTELRVCAYCRVSTDNVEQTSSFELQRLYYEEYIAKHENWKMVGIYADEGISGTSMKNRPGVQQMLADCRDGKIDLIIIKSVSRFSRNVVECIDEIRKLKTLNPPVRVFFESEGIDTGDSTSDVMLNILAIFAQEESHTKSQIMEWSIDNRFARGNFLTPRLFGYEIDPDAPERYRIVEEEAEIVRLVYSLFVTGYKPSDIADIMGRLGYVSNIKGERKWNAGVVNNMIENERRCGMVIARKTYTPDFTTHKARKNVNQRNKYQLIDHHEGIIAVELYKEALRIKEMRRHRNFDAIPVMSVVSDGVLKGFVPVSIKYAGLNYDNYLFASNFIYEKDKNGQSIISNKSLRKSDISDFDLSGYEKVDTQLFLNASYPSCWFKIDSVCFNTACVNKMNEPEYVQLLYEPKEDLLAIRTCSKETPNAIKWCNLKKGKMTPSRRSSYGFSSILFEHLGWDISYKYKMVGTKRTKGDETIVIFDLSLAEPIMNEKVEIDNETKTIAVNLYNEFFVDHFGSDFYEDAYSSRLYLIDIFKKWNVDADIIPVEDEPDWMVKAREIVDAHLSKLMEVNN